MTSEENICFKPTVRALDNSSWLLILFLVLSFVMLCQNIAQPIFKNIINKRVNLIKGQSFAILLQYS